MKFRINDKHITSKVYLLMRQSKDVHVIYVIDTVYEDIFVASWC